MESTRGTDVKTRGRHPYEPGTEESLGDGGTPKPGSKCCCKRGRLSDGYIFLEKRAGLFLRVRGRTDH